MRQGGGREGELSKKNKENVIFGQKLANFLRLLKKFEKFPGNVTCKKPCNFLVSGRG